MREKERERESARRTLPPRGEVCCSPAALSLVSMNAKVRLAAALTLSRVSRNPLPLTLWNSTKNLPKPDAAEPLLKRLEAEEFPVARAVVRELLLLERRVELVRDGGGRLRPDERPIICVS